MRHDQGHLISARICKGMGGAYIARGRPVPKIPEPANRTLRLVGELCFGVQVAQFFRGIGKIGFRAFKNRDQAPEGRIRFTAYRRNQLQVNGVGAWFFIPMGRTDLAALLPIAEFPADLVGFIYRKRQVLKKYVCRGSVQGRLESGVDQLSTKALSRLHKIIAALHRLGAGLALTHQLDIRGLSPDIKGETFGKAPGKEGVFNAEQRKLPNGVIPKY